MRERCFSCECDTASNEMMIKNRVRNLEGLVQQITVGTLNQENWSPSPEWNKFSVATTPVYWNKDWNKVQALEMYQTSYNSQSQ
jgi:hypothetical protein